MAAFQHYSIQKKLITLGLLSAGGALLLTAGALLGYNVLTYRTALAESLSTLGEIVSLNASSAIVFNDSAAATTTLTALKARRGVVRACIYTPEGKPFAIWQRDPKDASPLPPLPTIHRSTHRFTHGTLQVFHPIVLDNATIGVVYLESDLNELSTQRRRYVLIAGIMLVFSLALAGSIASQVAQRIASPIRHLAETAHAVSERKDYSVRAHGGGHDEVGGLIATFNDMLAKIQADGAELRKAHDQLEERVAERTQQLSVANSELEAFSYSVSHDLRAPVRHISGFADLLLKNPAVHSDPVAERYLRLLTDAAKKMGSLIDDLLSFSRMGRTELLNTTLHLTDLIESVVAELRGQVGGREVEWVVGQLPIVHGDPAMLRLVFVNLLSNALKYSRRRQKAIIEVGTLQTPEGEQTIFVRDNGAGFDMKYADKLFGVFQRLHNSDEFEGTGIGLATVRRIIQRHGGKVWAESAVDQGATFFITLH